jgi:hypothetical protein
VVSTNSKVKKMDKQSNQVTEIKSAAQELLMMEFSFADFMKY